MAVDSSSSPTLLHQLTFERHWQVYETFIKSFNRAVEEIAAESDDRRFLQVSVSKRQLERWLSGRVKTRPRPDQCRVLERMFGRTISELLSVAPSSSLVRQSVLARSRSVFALDEKTPHVATSIMSAKVQSAAQRSQRLVADYADTSFGQDLSQQLFTEVQQIVHAYPREPLSNVIGDLVATQDLVFHILESKLRPSQARDMFFFGAILTGILAKASHDLGNPGVALAHAQAAMVCADNAEHNPLRSWICGMTSLISYWAGDHRQAVFHAQKGAQLSAKSAGSVTTWLPSLEARAHASLGDIASTRQAIERAQLARERMVHDELDQLGGMMIFASPRQQYYLAEAEVLARNDEVKAKQRAEQAVRAYQVANRDEWSFADEAGAIATLGLSLVQNHDADAASAVMQPVFDLAVGNRINGILLSVDRVRAETATFEMSGSVKELRARIDAFQESSARSVSSLRNAQPLPQFNSFSNQ